mmetsp:Transcript_39391/g.122822  ORF Transcript_39391/g.122822 Transcript_39391/m.122822 type:complete len:133 (+) Transcript_39391:508-906(+)
MLVGGTTKVGEDVLATATRELQEELGIQAERDGSLQPLGLACEVRTSSVRAHCTVFAFAAQPSFVPAPQDGEVAEFAWRSVQEVRVAVEVEPELWVASGLQVWKQLEAAEGLQTAVERLISQPDVERSDGYI